MIINIAADRHHRLPQHADLGQLAGGAGGFPAVHVPPGVTEMPFVGWIFTTLLDQGPITHRLLVIRVFLQILLFRSRWGLRTRAVGEHPQAAETVGINVIRLRYRNVVLSGRWRR